MFRIYQGCITKYAEYVEPLREIQRTQSFVWKEHHTKALERLKKSLVNATRLAFPNHRRHMTKPSDASNIGIGACLNQIHPTCDLPAITKMQAKEAGHYEKFKAFHIGIKDIPLFCQTT